MNRSAPPMLVVFDIDGTLTHTTGIDDSAFVASVSEVLGVPPFPADWANYQHVTDGGLLMEASERSRGRPVTPAEQARVKAAFFARIAAHAEAPGNIVEVPGAAALLAALRKMGCGLALSTGAWRESARLKLVSAGFGDLIQGPAPLPAAFADEAISRAEIATLAIRRAGLDAAQPRGIVYVGDGVWDVRTSRALDLGFVGVRVEGDLDLLRSAGAARVVRDYKNLDAVLRAIEEEARSPSWRG
ncbi:MAG: HAD family hydrolase [Phycisphaerales bacterium]